MEENAIISLKGERNQDEASIVTPSIAKISAILFALTKLKVVGNEGILPKMPYNIKVVKG